MSNQSKACCELPAAQATDYKIKGHFKEIGDMNCYVTGPTMSERAIFFCYDVFGFYEPTLQGADILTNNREYLVVMPDFFNGRPIKMEWFARDTEEKRQNIQNFMSNMADPGKNLPRLYDVLEKMKEEFPTVKDWRAIGYCWGGKMIALTSGEDTPWKAAVQTSPSRIDPNDAKLCTIPMAVLASGGEDEDLVNEFGDCLKVPKHVEIFDDQVHGFMSARADLKDPKVKKEYERGYQVALNWFAQHS